MIRIYNASREEKALVKRVEKATYDHFGQKDVFLSELTIVTPEEIKSVNATARGVDAVTDVLSFPEQNIAAALPVKASDFSVAEKERGRVLLGSILICRTRAEEQAEEYGHSVEREIGFLTVHALLHLFGFDHIEADDEKIMRAHQHAILEEAGLGL